MANKLSNITPVKRKVIPVVKQKEEFEIECADLDNGLSIDFNCRSIFSAQINEFVNCCAMREFGDFSFDSKFTKNAEFNKTLDLALHKLVDGATSGGKNPQCKTFIANLIPSPSCNCIRESFVRTGLFAITKVFKNMGTGRQIEVWISTN